MILIVYKYAIKDPNLKIITINMIPIFIGYDTREPLAFHVCSSSIIRYSKSPVSIIPLALNLLNTYTETHTDGSNQFTYSRFLVPYLMNYKGHAIYLDGDMLVREDISNLFDLKLDQYAVQVVKHNYSTKKFIKYLKNKNENYPMKNWSSVMIWNCEHQSNKILTTEYVESNTGVQLHQFKWLEESLIGSLPIEWNWLHGEYEENYKAKLIHYTLGIPNFEISTTNSEEWYKEISIVNYVSKN